MRLQVLYPYSGACQFSSRPRDLRLPLLVGGGLLVLGVEVDGVLISGLEHFESAVDVVHPLFVLDLRNIEVAEVDEAIAFHAGRRGGDVHDHALEGHEPLFPVELDTVVCVRVELSVEVVVERLLDLIRVLASLARECGKDSTTGTDVDGNITLGGADVEGGSLATGLDDLKNGGTALTLRGEGEEAIAGVRLGLDRDQLEGVAGVRKNLLSLDRHVN